MIQYRCHVGMQLLANGFVREKWITVFGGEDEVAPHLRERLGHGEYASRSFYLTLTG